jgi:hypothetical protein
MRKAPNLSVVSSDNSLPRPNRTLGKHGSDLWTAILDEYDIKDAGGLELLTQACQALDRAEACREQIEKDGIMVRKARGWKDHPALRHESAARGFVVRTLKALGITEEPVGAIGRPQGSFSRG